MKKFSLQELLSLPSIYFPVVNRARNAVAYYSDHTGRMELYVKALAGDPQQISQGQIPRAIRTPVVWALDDTVLVFANDRDGDEQFNLWGLDIETGATEVYTDSQGQHYPVAVSPDGQWLSFCSNRSGQMNLFVIHLPTKEVTQVTDGSNPVFGGFWDVSGRWLYCHGNESENFRNTDVFRVRPEGGPRETLFSSGEGNRDSVQDVSSCGQFLLLNSNKPGHQRPELFDLADSALRPLAHSGDEESGGVFSPDGSKFVTIVHRDARQRLRQYDTATGEGSFLKASEGVIDNVQYLHDGSLLYTHESSIHRNRIIVASPDAADNRELVAAEYGSFAPELFADGEYISFPSFDGRDIYGILYRPPGTSSENPIPAIVWVHGGPTGQDVLDFDPRTQLFVNRGFAVLKVNYRGSTGYGKEFQELNIGDIGGGDAKDVAAGARYLAADPSIDPKRIIVGGGSYGGYMTYWQLVAYPELWAGGIAWVGITDWYRLYETSMEHFKYYLKSLFGDPAEHRELYQERSPLFLAHNLQAPLLMIHGVNDPRCPVEQARLFRDRMVELDKVPGADFVYHELSAEGHGSTDIQQKIRVLSFVDDFLQRFQ